MQVELWQYCVPQGFGDLRRTTDGHARTVLPLGVEREALISQFEYFCGFLFRVDFELLVLLFLLPPSERRYSGRCRPTVIRQRGHLWRVGCMG